MFQVDIARLKKLLPEKGFTQDSLADDLSICRTTFYRKMKRGGEGFTLREVYGMSNILSLTQDQIVDIFLNQKLH